MPPKIKNYQRCAAVSCSNKEAETKLFCFPVGYSERCLQRLKIWADVAGRPDLAESRKQAFLCAKHFQRCQFTNDTRLKLLPTAVPSKTAAHKGERFEQVKKIVETSKTTNLKSKQVTSTAAPRAMGQRNSSGRLVSTPDVSSTVNASSSPIDPLVLPSSSHWVSILPTRIESESSSYSLFYDPHEVPEIDVKEEIEEFNGESREICEEQTHIVSDLQTEFEQVKKIVETIKTTNLKSKQVTSTAAPRAMGQRNSSGRLVSTPDVASSVNASSSLIDPLVLPGSSRSVSVLPTRIETESSSVSLVYDPHEVPEIDVKEEIKEFNGESREICEEQTHIVSDLHIEFEQVKKIVETSKTTNLKSKQVTSTAAPRAMGQRNSSGRLVSTPDVSSSVNASSSLIDALVLPSSSHSVSILPTRIESESSSYSLFYDPHEVPEIDVKEEIKEFNGDSRDICEEQTLIVSDLHTEFEQVKKIVETSKTTNLKSKKQVTSTAAPRAMGQRNSSGRLVSTPDVSSSLNASSSLISGSSRSVSVLPTRIETESSSVSLVYDPHEVPEIDVKEEEIKEFNGESREICEEQTHTVSDLHTENLKEVLLRLKAEKLVVELEKLKMDRKKLEAEKRNIALRTKVLELRKKLASVESDEDESCPLTSLPRAEKNPEPRSEVSSPLPNKTIFLHTPITVQEDPHSDINTMAKRVSSLLVKSATSGRSERKKIQSQLRKPILRETSVELCQVRRKSSDKVTKDDDMLSKSPAESIDVPGILKAHLHLHGTIDINQEELSGDSFDSSNPGILESLLKVKQTEPQFSSLEGAKHVHEHREEESDSSSRHDSDVSVSGSTHVSSGIEDDFAGPLAKRIKYADGPS